MHRLNKYGAKFISLVKVYSERNEPSKLKGSAAHLPFVDWSDKLIPGPTLVREVGHDNTISKIHKTIKSNRYGFDNSVYPHFIRFVSHIANLPDFTVQASEKFILEETFNWVVDSFIEKKINIDLIPYLYNKVESAIEERTFHFPVFNLHIEESFKIGNSTFQYFTKDYFDSYINQLENKSEVKKKELSEILSRYCGRVFVSCTAKAEYEKAEELAFKEACLVMDVFRLLSPSLLMPLKPCKTDLERRININFSSDYLSEKTTPKRLIGISKEANHDPFYCDNETIGSMNEVGLNLFSTFIESNRNSETRRLIVQAISFYSSALSLSDIHLRITHLIMIAESLLLEQEYVKGMERKCKRRICTLLFNNEPANGKICERILSEIYKVRHEMMHKGNRLPIDKNKLLNVQILLLELIKSLIKLAGTNPTKDKIIKYADSFN